MFSYQHGEQFSLWLSGKNIIVLFARIRFICSAFLEIVPRNCASILNMFAYRSFIRFYLWAKFHANVSRRFFRSANYFQNFSIQKDKRKDPKHFQWFISSRSNRIAIFVLANCIVMNLIFFTSKSTLTLGFFLWTYFWSIHFAFSVFYVFH